MNNRVLLPVIACICMLGACGHTPGVITDGSDERRATAERDQRIADAYRRDGTRNAALQAQERADRSRAAVEPSSFVGWLLDVLLYSWLGSSEAPSRQMVRNP
jgi:hypothetical protein